MRHTKIPTGILTCLALSWTLCLESPAAETGVGLDQVRETGKEVQAAGTVSGAEHFQKEALEQPREHAHVQKEVWPAG